MPVPATPAWKPPPGVVVVYAADAGEHACEHERVTQLGFAERLAALLGYEAAGAYDPACNYPGPVYFVPSNTLTGEQAAALGIRGPQDLFGGVVPQRFVRTKAISHGLVAPGAATVAGWNPDFGPRVGDAVLAGYCAFAPEDALEAGLRLLRQGPARIKSVRASGGRGQSVARDADALRALLAAIDPQEICSHGVVLEEDLEQVRTFSVGQVRVADLVASYFGFQKLTSSNKEEQVYGGSDLTVARGGFDLLLRLDAGPEILRAVDQARRYDAAVDACFPGFFASRRNYDVLVGRDRTGAWRSGVLEQSWRIGGATGCELAALEVFRQDPGRQLVRASGFEVFGDSPEPPPQACVHFRGDDPEVGRLTKYTVVGPG